ncbi:hypothetical protein KR200_009421, partial [Drosophila serrata]
NELMPGERGASGGGEQPGSEEQRRQEEQLPGILEELDFERPQRPHSLGSNVIQESADYVLQLLHAYAAAFGL